MVEIHVKDIERIRRNSAAYKKFLNSTDVENLLEAVGKDLKPFLESTTGDSFNVRVKPSSEPRAGVEVYAMNFNSENFHNASAPRAVINFINANGGGR